MTKILPRSEHAVANARAFHARARIKHADEINIPRLAGLIGARLEWAPLVNQNAHVICLDGLRVIALAERLRKCASIRFDAAHEMGHVCLEHPTNEIGLCTGEMERTDGHRWRYEREAHDWATECTMPEEMFAPKCAVERPTFDHVRDAADFFGLNFRAVGLRFVELCPQPCALVFSVGGRIKWSVENGPFALKIVKGRELGERTTASKIFGGASLPGRPLEVDAGAWHALKRAPKVELWEHVVEDDEMPGATLSWLWHRA